MKFSEQVLKSICQPDELVNQRRVQNPRRGRAMDYENSRSIAIEEFCRNCMQQADCSSCTARQCALFPYRPGGDKPGAVTRRPGDVPTQEQYAELLRLQDPDGAKAQAMRERMGWAPKAESTAQAPTEVMVSEDEVEW